MHGGQYRQTSCPVYASRTSTPNTSAHIIFVKATYFFVTWKYCNKYVVVLILLNYRFFYYEYNQM